jgi:hypothetical protein
MSLFRPLPPTRYEVDFQCPVEFRIVHVHRIEFDPEVIELFHDIFNPEPQMTKQELVDLIKNMTTEVTSLMDAEHQEVLKAVEDSKNAAGDVPPEVVEAVQAFGNSVKDGVQKIFDAAGTGPVPTP